MSKNYFAKYLPVEGEIDTTSEQHKLFDEVSKLHQMDRYHALNFKGSWKLAKLFLCSRDIQVGDKAYSTLRPELGEREVKVFPNASHPNTVGWSEVGVMRDYLYKAIGEISPEATWVKEGNEFDEAELQIKYHETYKCLCKTFKGYEDESCSEYSGGTNKYVDGCYRKEKLSTAYEIKIKGPCGHFH